MERLSMRIPNPREYGAPMSVRIPNLRECGAPAIGIESSFFHAVWLGQLASDIPKLGSLGFGCYEVGEAVGIRRSDGTIRIGQIREICLEFVTVLLGEGKERQVPAAEVPISISKLLGPFCLNSTRVFPQSGFANQPRISQSLYPPQVGNEIVQSFHPLRVGEGCDGYKIIEVALQPEHFFEQELVSVNWQGRNIVGQIHNFLPAQTSVDIVYEYQPEQALHIVVPYLQFCGIVRKFAAVSLFYRAAAANDSISLFPDIYLGSTLIEGLPMGPADEKSFPKRAILSSHTDFFPGEAVLLDKAHLAQVISTSNEHLEVEFFDGESLKRLDFKDEDLERVRKIAGEFYLFHPRDQSVSLIVDTTGMVKINNTEVCPVWLDNISTGYPRIRGVPLLLLPKQPVIVRRQNGQENFAVVSQVWNDSISYRLQHDLADRVCGISSQETVFQLKGRYYLWTPPWYFQIGFRIQEVPSMQSPSAVQNFGIQGGPASEQARRMQEGHARRQRVADDLEIKKLFENHTAKRSFTKGSLQELLQSMDIRVSAPDMREFTDAVSWSNHGSNNSHQQGQSAMAASVLQEIMTLDDFTMAARWRWPYEVWADSLHLSDMLADALPRDAERASLNVIADMTSDQIEEVANAFCAELKRVLVDRVALLKKASTVSTIPRPVPSLSGSGSAKEVLTGGCKFQQVNITDMDCGKISDFHEGLEKRVGWAQMNFEEAMYHEHCVADGRDYPFTTTNYPIDTTPHREWTLVVVDENGKKAVFNKEEAGNGRRIPDVDNLLKMDLARGANLRRAEIIAVVLYTGPMAAEVEEEESEDSVFGDVTPGRCTILALVSAVQKLAQLTKLKSGLRLYRGMSGTRLPPAFYKCDENGCKGYTDWAFMSATEDKNVAIQYSGVKSGKELPTVLEVRVGSVDRGACIMAFSQYPQEREYLYVPCSFVEQESQPYFEDVDGRLVTVLPVRVNVNLKARTVDELEVQKKEMHLSSFRYLINEMKTKLEKVANDRDATKRLAEDRNSGGYKIDIFLDKIVEQYQLVYKEHQATEISKYIDDKFYRELILEMVDTRMMAFSKLEEWLENKKGSFLKYRFDAKLRTVHRRRVSYLSMKLESIKDNNQKKQAALDLCKVKGLITGAIDERNQLDETRLMAASAEGRNPRELQLLVVAGADVNVSRKDDGVHSLWLASQSGHLECIEMLLKLGANVNQVCKQGATPISMAAQSGHVDCVKFLSQRKADVNLPDNKGLTPMHQAAMNGHLEVINALKDLKVAVKVRDKTLKTPLDYATEHGFTDCYKALDYDVNPHTQMSLNTSGLRPEKKLIISTGDVSDVDGFFAFAEYLKTGADVLFIMNYPACLGVTAAEESYATSNPGLGYKFPISVVRKQPLAFDDEQETDSVAAYNQLLESCKTQGNSESELMKQALTDVAFEIVRNLRNGCPGSGRVIFCVGGINSINPFSAKKFRNDVYVYARLLGRFITHISAEEGRCYEVTEGEPKALNLAFSEYSDILMDFNGSMAFLNEPWLARLSEAADEKKLKGVFVMGGVRAEEKPCTMPALQGELNRFSSATMNQLYHPRNTAAFFDFIKTREIPIFIVTNNAIEDLKQFDKGKDGMKAVETFLSSNGLDSQFMQDLCKAHYLCHSHNKPAKKPYDYYVAVAVRKYLQLLTSEGAAGRSLPSSKKMLFYSSEYGISLVSESREWEDARRSYVGTFDVAGKDEDTPFDKSKKDAFRSEVARMRELRYIPSIAVQELRFKKLSMEDGLKLALDE